MDEIEDITTTEDEPEPRLQAEYRTGPRLPDFLIIGAMRSGTTTLYEALCSHPDVGRAAIKETHYLDKFFFQPSWWYMDWFQAGGRAIGEATPIYLVHPQAPERAAALMPDAKLIAILREPVARAYSHYIHVRRGGAETLPFDAALDREAQRIQAGRLAFMRHSYQLRGHYAEQLDRWAEHYPRERILVLQAEAFFADPQAVLDTVWDYLGLGPWTVETLKVYHRLDYPPLAPQLRQRLAAYYRPHNERLYEGWVDWRWDK